MKHFVLIIILAALCSCSLSRNTEPLALEPKSKPQAPVPPAVPPAVVPSVPGGTSEPVAETAFSIVRDKVFKISCFKCHSQEGGNTAGLNLETYESAFEARFEIATAINEGRMPPRKVLPEDQQKILVAWLTGGAKP